MLIDQLAALLDKELQAARLQRVGLQTVEPLWMLDQVVQDEIGIAGVALGPGRADAEAVMSQLGGVQREEVHMGILGQHGNQRTAHLFQRQGDRPAAERPGQFDGPDFYGFWSMLQFTAGAFAFVAVSYTHLRAHETDSYLVCRLLLE